MAVLIRAGVPIRGSLERLDERMPGNEVALLSARINAGERIGDAFAAAGFSSFEAHLVAAGERSAHLDTIFDHLAEFWSRELEMRQAMLRPLYYPVAVLHLAIAVGALIEAQATSWPEAIVHGIKLLALLYVGGFILYTLVRVTWSSESMRGFWLYVPIIGSSLATAYAYRWITALKLEFSAGVSLPSAVGDAWLASGYLGSHRLAEDGEQAMRSGSRLSALVQQWRQLPRDWIDFIETGEISGAFEEAFTALEKEAARAWALAQQRMTAWVPKILYFVVLVLVAIQVGAVMKKAYIDPIVNAEAQVDNAMSGK